MVRPLTARPRAVGEGRGQRDDFGLDVPARVTLVGTQVDVRIAGRRLEADKTRDAVALLACAVGERIGPVGPMSLCRRSPSHTPLRHNRHRVARLVVKFSFIFKGLR